jgi:hypothetical protein
VAAPEQPQMWRRRSGAQVALRIQQVGLQNVAEDLEAAQQVWVRTVQPTTSSEMKSPTGFSGSPVYSRGTHRLANGTNRGDSGESLPRGMRRRLREGR